MSLSKISQILGPEADNLLQFESKTFQGQKFTRPSSDFVDQVFAYSDRNNQVLRSLQSLYGAGRLKDTGYLSIFPVDQGIEHTAGASFAANPLFFNPENIVKMAIEGGCSGVASTLGVLAICSRKYAHKIPFIVKVNHRESLTHPNNESEVVFSSVDSAWNLGAAGIGMTIHFGSGNAHQEMQDVRKAFARAHELGMFTILWCYLRNDSFKINGVDYHSAADLTGQACHLGVTLGADIIKQKPPKNNGAYQALSTGKSPYGKLDERIYSDLTTDHPIDLTKYQVANCYMGQIPLINSGNPSGDNDMFEAVKAAVINKRAGGAGLIMGRKAFQKPFEEGVKILHASQDVYLCQEITVA